MALEYLNLTSKENVMSEPTSTVLHPATSLGTPSSLHEDTAFEGLRNIVGKTSSPSSSSVRKTLAPPTTVTEALEDLTKQNDEIKKALDRFIENAMTLRAQM
jgi:hypothetical protein